MNFPDWRSKIRTNVHFKVKRMVEWVVCSISSRVWVRRLRVSKIGYRQRRSEILVPEDSSPGVSVSSFTDTDFMARNYYHVRGRGGIK